MLWKVTAPYFKDHYVVKRTALKDQSTAVLFNIHAKHSDQGATSLQQVESSRFGLS